MGILNLKDALTLYSILEPYLFEVEYNMSDEEYILEILIRMKEAGQSTQVFRLMAVGTDKDAEEFLRLPINKVIPMIKNKLKENYILYLRQLIKELKNAN